MLEEDKQRLDFTLTMVKEFSSLNSKIYSSMSWPVKLIYPYFDARAAYSVPNNYYQNIFIEEERLPNSFAHGAMRSIFFSNDRLILFSKSVNFKDGKEFFTSFLLSHFEKSEYKAVSAGGELKVTVDITKPLLNLITKKVEKKHISFTFIHQSLLGRIVSKEQVLNSARFKEVYNKNAGGAMLKSGSIDIEGYAVTVPHFAPHPYLQLLSSELGFKDNREMQEKIFEKIESHFKG
jgi:hypothetical protein